MGKRYLNRPSNFNKTPYIEVKNDSYKITKGWDNVVDELNKVINKIDKKRKIIVIETYQGVIHEEVMINLQKGLQWSKFINAEELMFPEKKIKELVFPDVTNDRLFGYLTRLHIEDFYNTKKVKKFQAKLKRIKEGTIIVYGTGAAYVCPESDLLIYADMARWEIELRMRKHLVDNIGVKNRNVEDSALLYKQGFFVDWRVCDRFKKKLFKRWDFLLDTNKVNNPKLITAKAIFEGLEIATRRPFSVVPFFDPGPWGGQWMKEVCDLDKDTINYAWSFNGVPEENSLLLKFGDDIIEIPSIDLVFLHPRELLGEAVHGRFGDEFPIRFDFLDTMDGGNLSLQVHPLTEYIQEKFGMHYTQDESYYLVEADTDAQVFLGLKEGINSTLMITELEEAQAGGKPFDAEKHVQTWPVKKHDHLLIPAGTVHCSGKNCMVLEISSTPYIFTFKLWDWGRLGLDGRPRPINIEHGKNVIQWDRTTNWTRKNLVDQVEKIAEGDGWIEERTGLHEREFIETRRHWFTKKTEHDTQGKVNMICLVEGDEIIVESLSNTFEPFIVHYAEVFIVPAIVGKYTISPHGSSIGSTCVTVKAYVK
ncbi:MAG TPA: class I mannose-6-phosphate isomerase [Paludibacteraceae bacterium]|nr:class I mannose-6-phosphate isomerase [Paludibacteraceae bacterium]HRU63071.1 class I mannose-6-phosphate isomerase [Paludibacteraceae bacterium]